MRLATSHVYNPVNKVHLKSVGAELKDTYTVVLYIDLEDSVMRCTRLSAQKNTGSFTSISSRTRLP